MSNEKDAIDIVGERIAYWAGVNNPNAGKPEFSRYWSNLTVTSKGELTYGSAIPTSTTPQTLKSSTFENNTNVADSQKFTVNESTTDTFQWSLKEGVKVGAKFKAKIPLIGEAEASTEISFESSQTHTESKTKSWSYSFDVPIPAHTKIKTSFVIDESEYNIPFTAPVQVRGKCWIHFSKEGAWVSGNIDDLISKLNWDPRTFDVGMEGTFKARSGNNFTVKVDPISSKMGSLDESSSSIIDTGMMLDGKIVNNLFPISEEGPEG